MNDVNKLLAEAQKNGPLAETEINLIRKSFEFSENAHRGQKRKSGEPYFNHVYETAMKLVSWRLDAQTVSAGLLHDIREDTKYSAEDVKKNFGEEISFLVDGVTKISRIKYREGAQAENLRKMILALSEDLRVVLIKLADRLHNMKTLSAIPPQKQKRIAMETSEIYAPLAYRLGMANLAGELEDLTFPYTHPQEYKWLVENIKEKYEERQKYLEKVRSAIENKLKESGILPLKIDARAKRWSSLYKKLFRCDMNLDQIYDLVALRIIVKTIEECYATMGIIHQFWPPLPGKIKDYIALPKPNGYRSLHTTVLCMDNKPTEFQIRTEEMHEEAENGIAAHWAYAESKTGKHYQRGDAVFAGKKETAWIKQLKEWQKEIPDSEEFIHSFKIDFLKDRIFAITPKGEVIDLPAGSTPIDFAYAIHSQIGDQTIGAKINGKIASLEHQLQSGDLVEIMIQKSKKPSESWLKFIKTASARRKIKSAIHKRSSLGKIAETEFKIIANDRIGLLKDLSSVISRSHINILKADVPKTDRLPVLKIRCAVNDKEKIEKLILKLKEIKGVKEISYKTV